MTIPELFARRGEGEFRAGEARVILRLLESGPAGPRDRRGRLHECRHPRRYRSKGVSIWLKAESTY